MSKTSGQTLDIGGIMIMGGNGASVALTLLHQAEVLSSNVKR